MNCCRTKIIYLLVFIFIFAWPNLLRAEVKVLWTHYIDDSSYFKHAPHLLLTENSYIYALMEHHSANNPYDTISVEIQKIAKSNGQLLSNQNIQPNYPKDQTVYDVVLDSEYVYAMGHEFVDQKSKIYVKKIDVNSGNEVWRSVLELSNPAYSTGIADNGNFLYVFGVVKGDAYSSKWTHVLTAKVNKSNGEFISTNVRDIDKHNLGGTQYDSTYNYDSGDPVRSYNIIYSEGFFYNMITYYLTVIATGQRRVKSVLFVEKEDPDSGQVIWNKDTKNGAPNTSSVHAETDSDNLYFTASDLFYPSSNLEKRSVINGDIIWQNSAPNINLYAVGSMGSNENFIYLAYKSTGMFDNNDRWTIEKRGKSNGNIIDSGEFYTTLSLKSYNGHVPFYTEAGDKKIYISGHDGNKAVVIALEFQDSYIDIGLRVNEGTPTNPRIVAIAAYPEGNLSSPVRMAKNGKIYALVLVEPNDPNASDVILKLGDGSLKALR